MKKAGKRQGVVIWKSEKPIFFGLFFIFIFLLVVFFYKQKFYKSFSNYSVSATEKQTAQKFTQTCLKVFDFRQCYTKLFKNYAPQFDQEYLLTTLEEIQKIDPRANDCHYVAHEITYAAIKKDVNKWMDKLKKMDLYWCSTGFLHGTIVSLSIDKKTNFNQVDKLDEFCQEVIKNQLDKSFAEESCYHSTGHVYIIESQGQIEPALKQCEIYDTENKRFHCYAGVFMESVQRDALVDHGLANPNTWKWDEVEKQEQICKSYKGLQGVACWMEMWPLYKANISHIKTNQSKLEKYFSLCERSGSIEAEDWCYKYGVYVAVDNGLGFLTKEQYQHACDIYKYDKKRRVECIRYLTLEYMRSNAIDSAESIQNICKNAVLENEQNCCNSFDAANKQQLKSKLEIVENNFLSCMQLKI